LISLSELEPFWTISVQNAPWYQTLTALNLYDSPALQSLATQAGTGRQLQFQPFKPEPEQAIAALPVKLREDDYPGWLDVKDLANVELAIAPYTPATLSVAEIQAQIPAVIAFCQAAMAQPNIYLWGGTVGPNYDCSGLVQHSFAAQGIWLPRDAYQQEAFVQPIMNPGTEPVDLVPRLQTGDLIFFGTPAKATHVAIYLQDGNYIHGSGISQGRNGIGIDQISPQGHPVTEVYYRQIRGAGRVIACYAPQ
jgi:cell wall-associated NlpC family hydrolase